MLDDAPSPLRSAMEAVAASPARREGWSLTTHLALLAVAIMVPLLFLAGLSLHNHLEAARLSLHQDAQRMADNLAANIEREMAGVTALLNVLAQDTAFDRGEYGLLYERAKEGLKGRNGYVVLFGAEPAPLFSTRFAYGTPLPPPVDDGSSARVMETRRPVISNLFFGRAAQRRIFTVIVPVIRESRVVGRLHLALEPQDLTHAVMPVGMEPQWGFSIADRNFITVISSDAAAYQTGQPVQHSVVAQMHANAGVVPATSENGEPLLTAYRRSADVGWTAFATIPLAVVERPLTELWRKFAFIGMAAFTISLLAAYGFSRAMARPIHQLTGLAGAFGEGREIPFLHSTLREANLLSMAFTEAASQLRRRTRALAESERRFRLFAEQTQDAIWFADLGRRSIDYISPALETISGIPAGETTTIEDWRRAVHPDDLAGYDARFGAPPTASVQGEYRIRRPDGEERWVRDTRFPIELEEGKSRIVAGILHDITARRAAVEAVMAAQAEAEARLEEVENLYSSAPIGLALMDADCRLMKLNTFLAAMGGKSVGDYAAQPFFAAFPEFEEGAKQHCAEVLKTGTPARNIELATRRGGDDADPQYVLAHFYPVRGKSGTVSGIGAILENITERKRTEQVLDRLAAIVYAANDAMFSFAPTGRIQNWNPAAESLFQYGTEEVADRSFSTLFPEERDDDYQQLLTAWEAGQSLRLNTEMRRKDGTTFPASVSIAPIKEAGRTLAISTTIEDITGRRRSEQRQLLMNRELSHRVKNTLAVIQAMARHTLRSSPDAATFTIAFEGRLRALAISHTLLTATDWEGAEISELAREQLAAHLSAAGQLKLDGPKLLIPPGIATTLGLVLHELGTNAAKYGALSAPGGSILLKWRVAPSRPHKMLTVEWTERGGPPVRPPVRRGFGSVLIENSGKVEQHFDEGGLRCTIEMPLMEQGAAKAFS